jgi:tetratricopeptide (TPR) repeat protein
MWRLLPFVRWFWGAVVLTLGLGILTNLLFGDIRPEIGTLLRATALPAGVLLAAMAGLTAWAWVSERRRLESTRQSTLRQHFAVVKPIPNLQPSDFGFQVVQQGDSPDPRYRPYYDEYIPRKAVLYDQVGVAGHSSVYDENAIKDALRQGKGFVLLGQPLDGKTRMLYEVVRRLEDYWIVRPGNYPTPPETAFQIFDGRRVVFLLDDLNNYTLGVPDLREFSARLDQRAVSWCVAATCRDGSELGAVREALGTSLRRFYEDIPLKLGLLPLTPEQKGQLARGVGKKWTEGESDNFSTPGAITMEEPLVFIRERFQSLAPEHKDVLRGLKLLTAAGILPHTHRRLEVVLKSVFTRTLVLGDALDALAAASLIRRPARQDPVQPDAAYLRDGVTYAEGRSPALDFPALATALQEIGDAEGLFYLGITYLLSGERYQEAVNVYDRALQINSQIPEYWNNKAVALRELGRRREAMSAVERALELRPEFATAWFGKGLDLFDEGRPEEALAAYNRAVDLEPELALAWANKGVVLESLSRLNEAFAAIDRALKLKPDIPEAWNVKGVMLLKRGRVDEALAAFERAVELNPSLPDSLSNLGSVLLRMGRTEAALEVLERSTKAGPDHPEAWANLAGGLRNLQRWEDALAAAERALALRPVFSEAWREKGLALEAMNRPVEALTSFERALELNSTLVDAWADKGAVLHALGRPEEGLAAFKHAVELRPDSASDWNNLGASLNWLGRQDEALRAYERAVALQPELRQAWIGKAFTLEKLGRLQESQAASAHASKLP